MPSPIKKVIEDKDLYEADLFSFGSIIGQITNKSTSIYVLLNRFSEDSEEYKVLMNRLKMCTKLQSFEIDKAKIGQAVKGIPKTWIRKGDDEFLNSILLDKHPYFFRYLYSSTNSKYNSFIKNFDNKTKNILGISLEELKAKELLTGKEKKMLEGYHKYVPVLEDNSVMNNLCRYIESYNFDLRNKIKNSDESKIPELLMRDKKVDEEIYKKVLNMYTFLKAAKTNEMAMNIGSPDTYRELIVNRANKFKERAYLTGYPMYKIADALIYIMYVTHPIKNKALLWEICGDIILENLLKKAKGKIKIPIQDDDGEIEYLNKRYSLDEIVIRKK